jgi:hypothetical protein
MDRMGNLQVVSLLDCVSVESAARRGRSYREQLWLCWRRCASARCTALLSLALNSLMSSPRAQWCAVRKEGGALGK